MMDPGASVRLTITRSTRLRARGARRGFAASSLDLQEPAWPASRVSFAMILGVTAIMLLIAFAQCSCRSRRLSSIAFSVSAAFGITVLVFQHGYGASLFGLEGPTEAIFVVVPVLVFATVFGLSMTTRCSC